MSTVLAAVVVAAAWLADRLASTFAAYKTAKRRDEIKASKGGQHGTA